MTDRDLLERAAEAAGLMFDPTVRHKEGLLVVRPDAQCQSDQVLWNPLREDSDALRLAVKLGLTIEREQFDGELYACATPSGAHQGYDEPHGTDPYAAARRAIVRAAALMAD